MPIKTIKTLFYHFSQNNSGGYFVTDEDNGVGEDMIIEATSPTNAWDRLREIGDKVDGFWDYCDCCGERWYYHADKGTETPTIYGQPANEHETYRKDGKKYIHYLDNSFEEAG